MPKIFATAPSLVAIALSVGAMLGVANAHAELGGAVTPAPANVSPPTNAQTTLRAQTPSATTPSDTPLNTAYTVQQITDEAGTRIREYADNNGVVFAVSWEGPVKPDLKQLLGTYFQPFIEASAATPHAGTGPVTVRDTDLVVHSGGHPRAFFGSAYVPTLIPNGVAIDALQ